MQVQLSERATEAVRRLSECGYGSPEEVVERGLALLQAEDDAYVERMIQEAEAGRGDRPGIPGDVVMARARALVDEAVRRRHGAA